MGVQGIELLKPETTDPDLEDENRVSHIVGPVFTDDGNKISGRARIMEAMVNGTPVEALCGYIWVPSRDPDNYPVCQACLNVSKGQGDG